MSIYNKYICESQKNARRTRICGWFIFNLSNGVLNVTHTSSAATVGTGAAINTTDGTLNIESGSINATAGDWGAGIGSGQLESGGIINIRGTATVVAQGGGLGAGIGGGSGGTVGASGTIII